MKQIIASIYGGICRFTFEFGLPIASIFFCHWYISVIVWLAFLGWQFISIVYLGPLYQQQLEAVTTLAITTAIVETIDEVRIELMGRLENEEQREVLLNVQSKMEKRLRDAKA